MADERLRLGYYDIQRILKQEPSQNFLEEARIDHRAGTAEAMIRSLTHPDFSFLGGHKFYGRIVVPGVTYVKMIADLLKVVGATDPLHRSNEEFLTVKVAGFRFKGVATKTDNLSVKLIDINRENGILSTKGQVLKGDHSKPIATGSVEVKSANFDDYNRLRDNSAGPLLKPDHILYLGNELDPFLPQKYPFRLVQTITKLEPGKWGEGGLVNTSYPEYTYSQGKLDGYRTIAPEYLIEAAAQIGTAVVLSMEENIGRVPLFAAINGVEAPDLLHLGQEAKITLEVTKLRLPMGWGNARIVRADGITVLHGELVFAIADPDTLFTP